MKSFKFKIPFSSQAKFLIDKEKDKYLSLANSAQLKKFLPANIDFEKRYDLLAFAGNAFIANRINKNDDGVTTKEAIDLANSFAYSYVDVEHKRTNLVGMILSTGFSEFGTDKPLTQDEVKNLKSPFNVVVAGIIWKAPNPGLAEKLEESNDPSSDLFNKVCLSWELGFSDYELIVLGADSKNTEDGKIISDVKEIKEMEKFLKINEGSGKLPTGEKLARLVIGDILPLGVGLTGSPAADVGAIVVGSETNKKAENGPENEENANIMDKNVEIINTLTANIEKEFKKFTEIISQNEKTVVKKSNDFMKITKLQDITDENLKQTNASEISEFINSEVQKAAEKFQGEQKAKQELETKYNGIVQSNETTTKELEKVKVDLKTLQDEKAEKEKNEAFSSRMSKLDTEYDLSDEDRTVIASQVKSLDEKSFADYEKNLKVLLKEKNKAFKQEQAAAKTKETEEAKAKENKEKGKEVVASAIEGGKTEPSVPNGTTTEKTMKEKFASAFSLENFEIKYKK